MTRPPRTTRSPRRAIVPMLVVAILAATSTVLAHDFWLIPDAFWVAADSSVRTSGRSGVRFPNGSAVQPARVADARIVGASSETKITQLSVEGSSLRLLQRPTAPGQYLIVVGLTPRTSRSTPEGLARFLRAEGGADEATRLDRTKAFAGRDSLVYHSASYATTIVQFGIGGPTAYNKRTGQPLQFIPLADPSHVHVGDTLHVRIEGNGKPLANTGLYANGVVDSTAIGEGATMHLMTDARGVAHIPLTKEGAWIIRAAHVTPRRGAAGEWDVARATYVFTVGAEHQGSSAQVVAVTGTR